MPGKAIKTLIVVLAAMIAAALPGCGEPTPTETQNEPEYANSITETLLQALINTEEYTAFRELFDAETQKGITEVSFQQTHDQFFSAYGEYVSKEFTGARENVQDIYTEVSYKAVFEKRPDGISVKVLFQETGDKVYASGVFFHEL